MFSVNKNMQLQLQVSNSCHVNNIFRTCCCTITKRPIDLKLGLSIQSRAMHVWKERFFFFVRIASWNFMQFTVILWVRACWPNKPQCSITGLMQGDSSMNYWPSWSEVIGCDDTTIMQCQSFLYNHRHDRLQIIRPIQNIIRILTT